MIFLHVAFLAGALAIAVPIALHLMMRQQPKHLEFPALRFIKLRQSANRRQMRLRHWLLLALRCAVVALLALSLARPSIVASGMLGDQEAPVAAALVFDVNPRMQYRQQNQTRLEVAQETAQWLLPQLPLESDVAVVDSRSASAAFAVDLGAARQRVERLDADTMTQPLAVALEAALRLVSESDKQRKEVYVFTDLSRATWSSDAMRSLTPRIKELTDVGVYLIDVGVADPKDFGLSPLRLSGDVLSKNSTLRVDADLVHVGPGSERDVELYLIDADTDKSSVRGRRSIKLGAGESRGADFQLRGLAAGMHQGYVKLVGEDALACDDVRWFTVEIRPAWRVLIVAPAEKSRSAKDYALFLSEAIAPRAIRLKDEAAFEYEVISEDQLANQSLDGVAAVCLLDPHPVTANVWQKLSSYVSGGGGLGVFLGRNAWPVDSFNEPTAQELLPGKLVRQWRARETNLAPQALEHPLLARFRPLANTVPWEGLPIFRHWQLGSLAKEAGVLVSYSNGQPALLERSLGKGRVLTLTTPISDPASLADAWNLLPTGEQPWPFVMLANEMMYYLVGSGQQRLNYQTGDTAVVRVPAGDQNPVYSLTTPRGDQIRTPIDEKQNALIVTSTEMPGNYQLRAGGGEQGVRLGFSANLPAEVGHLEPAGPHDLKAIFGDTPFRLAHNRTEIDRSVSAGRVGQELFPFLIVMFILALALEQALANRFYQDYDTAVQPTRAAQFVARAEPAKPPKLPVAR
jgi:hypothetical protein